MVVVAIIADVKVRDFLKSTELKHKKRYRWEMSYELRFYTDILLSYIDNGELTMRPFRCLLTRAGGPSGTC